MNLTSSVEWWRADTPAGPNGGRKETETTVSRPAHAASSVPYRALLAFTFVLFIAPQEFVPALAPLRPALAAAIIALAGHLIDRARHPVDWRTPREFVLAGALLAWALLTLPLSMWPGGSVSQLTDVYVKSLIVFWLLGRVVNTTTRLTRLAWMLSVLSLPISISAILNYRSGNFINSEVATRIVGYSAGVAGNPNDLALTLDIVLPFTIVLAVTTTAGWQRVLAAVIALLSVAGVIVTFSRGGFLALAVVIALSLLWLARRRPVVVAGVIALCLAIAPPLLPEGYVERLQTVADVDSDPTHSAQDRWRDTVAAANLVRAYPFVGAGLGMDVLALNEVRVHSWRSVHNVYLQYGVDLGLIGMLLFVGLLLSSIATARRTERQARDRSDGLSALAAAVRISLIAFACAGLFYPSAYYFYFYYLAGLAVALSTITGSAQ